MVFQKTDGQVQDMNAFLLASEKDKAHLMQNLHSTQQHLEEARIRILYLQGENQRYRENQKFFTDELQKLSLTFDNISMGKKWSVQIERRLFGMGLQN